MDSVSMNDTNVYWGGTGNGGGGASNGLQTKYSDGSSNLFDAKKLSLFIAGPSGVHVSVTDEVLGNVKDDSLFALDVQNGKVVMKAIYKNEINQN